MLSTSSYLDDFLDSDNPYFEQMVKSDIQDLQKNEASASDTGTPFSNLHLSMTNGHGFI